MGKTMFAHVPVTLVFDDVPEEAVPFGVAAVCPHHPARRIVSIMRGVGRFTCEGPGDEEGAATAREEHDIPRRVIDIKGHIMTVLDRETKQATTYEGRIHVVPEEPESDD